MPSLNQQWHTKENFHPILTQTYPTVLFTSEQESSQRILMARGGGLYNENPIKRREHSSENLYFLNTFIHLFLDFIHMQPTMVNKPSQNVMG